MRMRQTLLWVAALTTVACARTGAPTVTSAATDSTATKPKHLSLYATTSATCGGACGTYIELPAAAGTIQNPPIFACYYQPAGFTSWSPLVPNSKWTYQCLLSVNPATGNLHVLINWDVANQPLMVVITY